MLYEYDVIEAICTLLESQGYSILQQLKPKERGDDIIAEKKVPHLRKFFIEAKGETSSDITTKRFGEPFDGAQILDHVGAAFYKAAQILSRNEKDFEIRAGIGLPDNRLHRITIKKIEPVLQRLEIVVFWAQKGGDVYFESTWDL